MSDTITFHNVGEETLFMKAPHIAGLSILRRLTKEFGMYFGKPELYDTIRNVGGVWVDSKERPLVCLLKIDDSDIYWGVPVGNYDHRDQRAKRRLNRFVNLPEEMIESCYYHIGSTDVHTIFFISDVIPIKDEYIDREYLSRFTNEQYVIKNKKLKSELERKLKRIIAWENANPNSFRQHISSILDYYHQN